MYKNSLFIFRRDLRLQDNTGLNQALHSSETVIPCFIYDKKIVKSNTTFRFNFLNQSLLDLNNQLYKRKAVLQVFQETPHKIVKKIIKDHKINAVFLNKDFTSYSLIRDKRIEDVCKKNNVIFINTLDFLLHNPNIVKSNDGKPYTTFSHFFKKARQFPVKKIFTNFKSNFLRENISNTKIKEPSFTNPTIHGGRKNGLKILKNFDKFQDYEKSRDYPALDRTTKLSAHNKFGTVSIREVYNAIENKLGKDHVLMREIYWREFFNHVLFHFPESQKKSFNKRYEKINWSYSKLKFHAWCEGKTGFPIVDAGIRELNKTGFIHNRVRMIVASFLTKDLHIDWKLGERYFAKKLVDYDPAVNVGNWQWAASTGCDAIPYFRIFNPWRQQEKFDQDCKYIKKWIPSLKKLNPQQIHNLFNKFPDNLQYYKPIIDHKAESTISKQMFQSN